MHLLPERQQCFLGKLKKKILSWKLTFFFFGHPSNSFEGFFSARRTRPLFRVMCGFVLFFFIDSCLLPDMMRVKQAYANPPIAANLILPSFPFSGPVLRAIQINPQKPFEIDFIVDTEDKKSVREREASRLVEYFLAVLTIPEKELWVNLSPYEKDRIIPESLIQTRAGKDLLVQDQLLKQLTASLTYPETELGKLFWDRLYAKVYESYQTTDIPLNTFNKVWIVPDTAVVYEINNTAFIAESRLKVMLEEDYLARKENRLNTNIKTDGLNDQEYEEISSLSSEIVRDIILPAIEKEINQGEHFAPLRQIYHSLILAIWFKQKLCRNLINQIYTDQGKVKGIDVYQKDAHQKIYEEYLKTFKEGVYKYIRIEKDERLGKHVPRQYFSGGFDIGDTRKWFKAIPITAPRIADQFLNKLKGAAAFIRIKLNPLVPSFKDFSALAQAPRLTDSLAQAASTVKKKTGSRFNFIKGSWRKGIIFLFLMFLPFFGFQQAVSASSENQNTIEIVGQKHILKLGDDVSTRDQETLKTLKENLALEDILVLDGKKNSKTGRKYKIDQEYFRRNFEKIFNKKIYDWDVQVAVIAYQHKAGLIPDGRLGPQTRKSLASRKTFIIDGGDKDNKSQNELGPQPQDQEKIAVKERDSLSGQSQPVRQEKEPKKKPVQWQMFLNWAIVVLSGIIHTIVVFGRKELTVKHRFLKYFDHYLKGGKNHPFTSQNQKPLIPFLYRCVDILACQVYDDIHVTIKMGSRVKKDFDKKEEFAKAIRALIENGDIALFSNSDQPAQLVYEGFEIHGRNIRLRFKIPTGVPYAVRHGDIVSLKYRSAANKISTLSVPLVHDVIEELVAYWKPLLDVKESLTKFKIRQLVKKIDTFEQNPETGLDSFNRDVIAAFHHIRDLSIKTADVLGKQGGLEEETKYFINLARKSNRFRFLMGMSSIMYRLRTWFLPREDSLNIRLGRFRIDKLSRIGSGTERYLNRMRKMVDRMLPQYSFFSKETSDFIRTNISQRQGQDVARESLVDKHRSQWLNRIFSYENPKNHSIVGGDVVRRHQKIAEFVLVVIAAISLLSGIGAIKWVLAFWAFFRVFVFYLWLPRYIEKKIQREFDSYEAMINGIDQKTQEANILSSEKYLQFIEKEKKLKSQKQKFLNFLNEHTLEPVRPSKFILRAQRFFDAEAFARPEGVELNLKLETHLNRKSQSARHVQDTLRKALDSGAIRFEFDNDRVISPQEIKIAMISSRFFVNIKSPRNGTKHKELRIYFPDEIHPVVIPIEEDIARDLINTWKNYFHLKDDSNLEELRSIIKLCHDFRREGDLQFEKFRENAKFYYRIRRLALQTWKRIKDDKRVPEKYGNYFYLLSLYGNDVRNSMGEFSTADTYKGFFYSDNHTYGHRYRFSPSKILRNVFAFWFFYTWAKYNLLKSIKKHDVTSQDLDQMEEDILQLPASKKMSKKKKLFNSVQRIFYSYQFPREHSIIAGELYGRLERMWQMTTNIVLMALALLLPYFTFITHTIPIDRVFVLLMAIVYWVMPLQAHNQLRQDYLNFTKEVSLETKNKTQRSIPLLFHHMKTFFWKMNNGIFFLGYFLGLVYDARIIFGLFLFLQFQSLITKPKNGFNGNGNGNDNGHTAPAQTVANIAPSAKPEEISASSGIVNDASLKGGIDLNMGSPDLEILKSPDGIDPVLPANFPIQQFQGFEFKILQFVPILNPLVYFQEMFQSSEKLSYQNRY